MVVAVRVHNLYSWIILYRLYKLLKKLSKSLENFIKRYRCKWRNIKTANMVFKKVVLQDFLKINELKNFEYMLICIDWYTFYLVYLYYYIKCTVRT